MVLEVAVSVADAAGLFDEEADGFGRAVRGVVVGQVLVLPVADLGVQGDEPGDVVNKDKLQTLLRTYFLTILPVIRGPAAEVHPDFSKYVAGPTTNNDTVKSPEPFFRTQPVSPQPQFRCSPWI
jgi:hypothetical protein